MNNKAFFNWSTGKDSMLALHRVVRSKMIPVGKLITTINTDFKRVSMHGIHKDLLQQQADCLDIPLQLIELKSNISLNDYNQEMSNQLESLKSEGFSHGIFGDILLEDLKDYRESNYRNIGLEPIFPLWKEDTKQLIREFIDLGYQAIVVCVNDKVLDKSFCGRIVDEKFIEDLPSDVDLCGENGEFHTFVFDGPLFKNPVNFELKDIILRDYAPSGKDEDDCFTKTRSWDTKFWFAELV